MTELDFDFSEMTTITVPLATASYRGRQRAALALRKTAHDIEGTAKTFVPVDTGATKSSIHASRPDGTPLGSAAVAGADLDLVADIGPTTEYAPPLEYGTARMAPHAFMGPATDRHAWQLEKAAEQIAEDTLG